MSQVRSSSVRRRALNSGESRETRYGVIAQTRTRYVVAECVDACAGEWDVLVAVGEAVDGLDVWKMTEDGLLHRELGLSSQRRIVGR